MPIPVYVVTGFLYAGKTTFINRLLRRPDWRDEDVLVVQFENGEEPFIPPDEHCDVLRFSKKDWDKHSPQVVSELRDRLTDAPCDEIWIEWNGMTPFSELQAMLLHPDLHPLCRLKKVIHLADARELESLLGRTGTTPPEQIAASDIAILRNVKWNEQYRRLRRLIRGINPGVQVLETPESEELDHGMFRRSAGPWAALALAAALLVLLDLVAGPFAELFGLPFNKTVQIFLGILLQAVPFLLIGVLISSALQVLVPQSAIERRFPRSLAGGMVAAVLAGFCLPVCDCASIPIFRSLVKKGVPLPAAVTFMTVTPVVNPVVLLSTYYAFSGDWSIVAGRTGLGILAGVFIGLSFALRPPAKTVLTGGALDRLMCSCGCYEATTDTLGKKDKASLFIRHAQAEFFSVGKYLILGAAVASVFQTIGTGVFVSAQSGTGLALSILLMMAMAFLLSLCSSSDAVVARSFARQFPTGALMGFLVFGPMLDIKNVLMLSSGFTKGFILRLLITAAVVCFAVVFLASLGGGFYAAG